jgi:hypothetical protein
MAHVERRQITQSSPGHPVKLFNPAAGVTDMETLGEALPKEQARCRELLKIYREVGPAGAFAAMMVEQALQRADQAVIGGDILEMIHCYKELTEFEA